MSGRFRETVVVVVVVVVVEVADDDEAAFVLFSNRLRLFKILFRCFFLEGTIAAILGLDRWLLFPCLLFLLLLLLFSCTSFQVKRLEVPVLATSDRILLRSFGSAPTCFGSVTAAADNFTSVTPFLALALSNCCLLTRVVEEVDVVEEGEATAAEDMIFMFLLRSANAGSFSISVFPSVPGLL